MKLKVTNTIILLATIFIVAKLLIPDFLSQAIRINVAISSFAFLRSKSVISTSSLIISLQIIQGCVGVIIIAVTLRSLLFSNRSRGLFFGDSSNSENQGSIWAIVLTGVLCSIGASFGGVQLAPLMESLISYLTRL